MRAWVCWLDSRAAIAHADGQQIAAPIAGQANFAACRCGLHGVLQQVDQSAEQRLAAADDHGLLTVIEHSKFQSMLAHQGFDGLRRFAEQIAGVDHVAPDALPAGKKQHVLDQALQAAQLPCRPCQKNGLAPRRPCRAGRDSTVYKSAAARGYATGEPARPPSRPLPPGAGCAPARFSSGAPRSRHGPAVSCRQPRARRSRQSRHARRHISHSPTVSVGSR